MAEDKQSPPPAERSLAQQVFGQRAAYYVTSATHTDPQVLAQVAERAQPRPEAIVLDIGTGTGHTAFALAPHVRLVMGLDPTAEMLEQAEALRHQRGLTNVTWLLGDAHHLPLASRSVDIVTCRRAAHHFTDIRRALSEMRRVLKAGGRLVIDDRAAPEDPALDAFMNTLDLLHDPSHVREYRPSEWETLLEEAGFIVDAVQVYIQNRPIRSLTEDVAPENVACIYALVEGLSPEQAAALHLQHREGTLYFDHHYVLIAAHLPA